MNPSEYQGRAVNEHKVIGCPIVDCWGNSAMLEDMYLGGAVFLLCAGPSIRTLDLSKLQQRGIVTFGFNNVATVVRTDLWTFGDKPEKFHDVIWKDPGVMKFVPAPKLKESRLRRKVSKQVFENLGKSPRDMPNVFGIWRNSEFNIERWLWEDTINWGNSKKHQNGMPYLLNTMFQAVRLCYYLGFRTVYLLGADFNMTEELGYAFDERRSAGAVRGNMGHYQKLNWYFSQLRPWFESAGFEVVNCNPQSHLRAFDNIGYDDAVSRALRLAEIPETIDAYGWYEGFGDDMEDDE